MTDRTGSVHRALRDYYDTQYHIGSRNAHSAIPLHYHRLATRLIGGPDTRVLDVACGGGDWLAAVRRRTAELAGVDISAQAIRVAARRVADGLFAESTAAQLPFPEHCFDLVSCLGALEHFPDKGTALDEMRRVIADGGRLLVVVPNADFLTRRLGLFKGTEQASIREDVLSLTAWQQLFEAHGFEVCKRWRDLHVWSRPWLLRRGLIGLAPRLLQALLLLVWPLRWQYQVYFLLRPVVADR